MINLNYVFHFSSCGYYCLKHVIGKCKIKRVGYMSLFDMKEILMKYNYYCYCVKVRDMSFIKGCCITLIKVKNNFHYVVVKKIEKGYVYVYDPLFLFINKIKIDKFINKWSKICLFYKKITISY